MIDGHYTIGELAAALDLSLRTIRHYDELGIVVPSARSVGGFRLYTEDDLVRFRFVKKLKPLGFPLEEVQQMMAALDRATRGELADGTRERLEHFATSAEQRCAALREQLDEAMSVASELRRPLQRDRHAAAGDGRVATEPRGAGQSAGRRSRATEFMQ